MGLARSQLYSRMDPSSIPPYATQLAETIVSSANRTRGPSKLYMETSKVEPYIRSDDYIREGNKIRAAGLSSDSPGVKRYFESYDEQKNCTCNPAKKFKRMGQGRLLNTCNCCGRAN